METQATRPLPGPKPRGCARHRGAPVPWQRPAGSQSGGGGNRSADRLLLLLPEQGASHLLRLMDALLGAKCPDDAQECLKNGRLILCPVDAAEVYRGRTTSAPPASPARTMFT